MRDLAIDRNSDIHQAPAAVQEINPALQQKGVHNPGEAVQHAKRENKVDGTIWELVTKVRVGPCDCVDSLIEDLELASGLHVDIVSRCRAEHALIIMNKDHIAANLTGDAV